MKKITTTFIIIIVINIFHCSYAQIISNYPDQVFIGNDEHKHIGTELVSQGDVNGDGYSDILSLAMDEVGFDDHYIVEIYLGRSGGIDTIPFWSKDLGFGLKGFDISGDYNNDGYDDIIFSNDAYLNKGIVYCFNGHSTSISSSPSWSYSPTQLYSRFGYAQSNAGDVNNDGYDDLVVGAPLYDNGQDGEGAVLLFLGGSTGLESTYAWLEDNNKAGSSFGTSVIGLVDVNDDGFDDIAISAKDYPLGGSFSGGKIYVYYGKASGLQAAPAWTYMSETVNEYAGNTLESGDFNNDDNPDLVSGGLFIKFFYGNGATFSTSPDYSFIIPEETFYFRNMSIGDVNGDNYDDLFLPSYYNGYEGCGSAYDLDGPGCVIMQGTSDGIFPYPTFSTDVSFDECAEISMGTFIGDLNGDGKDEFIASDINYDEGSFDEPGTFYLYLGGELEVPLKADWTYSNFESSYDIHTGFLQEIKGDLDGDSIEDLLIGEGYSTEVGLVFLGSLDGLDSTYNQSIIPSNNISDVDCSGDLNGDGYDDCISGCYSCSTIPFGIPYDGKVSVFFGSESGIALTPAWNYLSDNDGAQLGYSVSILGDINGDGYDDIAVGAPYYDLGSMNEGIIHIFLGSASGPGATPAYTFDVDQGEAHLGINVTGAGDVNGDGYDDILFGIPDYDVSCTDDGVAMIFFGDPAEITYYPNWVHIGYSCGDKSGYSVAGAGDVNADGYDDIIIGAPNAYETYSTAGEAYLYLGGPEGPDYFPEWQVSGESADDNLGLYISTAGDYNADGYDDVLIGSNNYNYGSDPQGLVFLYMGNPTGLSPNHYKRIYKGTHNTYFAKHFTGGGDINGDGYDDFAIGEEDFTVTDENNIGRVYLFLGKPIECNLVTGISVSAITETSANINWVESDTSSIYYFQWKKAGVADWNSEILYSNTKILSGLSTCQNYVYRIQNICTSGASDFSAELNFTTICPPPCSSPPSSLSATVLSSTTVSLSWSVVSGALKYKVYYRQAGTTAWTVKNTIPNTTNITGLTPGTIYQYKIKAICSGGLSTSFSPIHTFTTPLKLKEEKDLSINIFPNPTNGKINVVIFDYIINNYSISVTNVFGQSIMKVETTQNENILDLSENMNGIYFISVFSDEKNVYTYSVVLNK
ncbi:MAG: FG-GAP repeat protein [Fimbriimonadaceae bacterium]|nr:FG-GAP repeat protein [Chitinophagales bacterium]